MGRQRKIMARVDRLSDLPDSILTHILSMLPDNNKTVVRTSVLSTRWRFLWKSVPVSLYFTPTRFHEEAIDDFVTETHSELYYWRSCQKIRKFSVFLGISSRFVEDVDIWVYFATKLANVEHFELGFSDEYSDEYEPFFEYEFPQFAYKNMSLRNLDLMNCILNPTANVNWTSLVSLSLDTMKFINGVMEKVLSGCPNLECLELHNFKGIHRLEINNVKLRKLIISYFKTDESDWLEILAPYIQTFQLLMSCHEIRLRNVASLVTAVLDFDFDFGDGDELQKESSCLKELLHSVAHVKSLELGPWCIECLSVLELNGWQSPPSSWKFLKLNTALVALDFPGICNFLQSSWGLETLVIDWDYNDRRNLLSKYTNEHERSRRFEAHYNKCSLLHLKTIKIIDLYGSLSENKSAVLLVKYLLKHATVLEKFVIADRFKESDYVKMEQEFLSFPRSSPHASIIFS